MNSNSSKITRLLLLQSAVALAMVVVRTLLTAYRFGWEGAETARLISMHIPPYLFLPWNLLLAWVPYALALWLRPGRPFWAINGALLVLWLLFFPNAPYIITDLIHLRPRGPVPYWYDTLMLFSFAWTGLLLGFFSLMEVQQYFERQWDKKRAQAVVAVAILLGSFGVYLGRFLRWNSWDALIRPFAVLKSLDAMLDRPMPAIGTTVLLTILMSLGYATFIQLSKKQIS